MIVDLISHLNRVDKKVLLLSRLLQACYYSLEWLYGIALCFTVLFDWEDVPETSPLYMFLRMERLSLNVEQWTM